MPQINNGKSPAWVAGEIVTAAELNGMIDAATLNPNAITDQSNFPTLTGYEYTLIVDPISGLLKKTQLKNLTDAGVDVTTDNIFAKTVNGTLLIQGNGANAHLVINSNAAINGGAIDISSKNITIHAESTVDNTGTLALISGTGGITLNSGSAGIGLTGNTQVNGKLTLNSTSAFKMPVGVTAQRPASPVAGDSRFNSDTNAPEFYNGTDWKTAFTSTYTGSVILLYELYEEDMGQSGGFVSSVLHTKPAGEIWIIEIYSVPTTLVASGGAPVYNFPTYSSPWNVYYPVVGQPFSIKLVYNSSFTFTNQTLGLWHYTGSQVKFGTTSDKFRIYKYKTA